MNDISILPDIPMPVGRPRKNLDEADWQTAEKLASILCTMEEISAFFGMSHHSFKRRLADKYEGNKGNARGAKGFVILWSCMHILGILFTDI
jgi:hypothetical protein